VYRIKGKERVLIRIVKAPLIYQEEEGRFRKAARGTGARAYIFFLAASSRRRRPWQEIRLRRRHALSKRRSASSLGRSTIFRWLPFPPTTSLPSYNLLVNFASLLGGGYVRWDKKYSGGRGGGRARR
jgi:hypothetical protein